MLINPSRASSRRHALAALTCGALALWAAHPKLAQAQVADWPQKPIKLVVPFSPGGSADTLGRLIAKHLGEAFRQTVVVDNKAGAGGLIGAQTVAKAAPDGYTLIISGLASHVIAPVDAQSGFDPMKDFTHIAMLAGPPVSVVVNAAQPVKDFKGFMKFVSDSPSGLSWGSSGQGTHAHLTGELFRAAAKLNMTHIAYKGGAPAMVDLVGNQIPAAFVALSTSNAHVQSGKLRLLALSSAKRLPEYPDVPTLAELGYPALTGTTWFALSGPAGMPAALVERINVEVRRGMNTATAKALLAAESMETADYDAPTFTRYVASEIERWTPPVRSLKSTSR